MTSLDTKIYRYPRDKSVLIKHKEYGVLFINKNEKTQKLFGTWYDGYFKDWWDNKIDNVIAFYPR
jgi:hypothetical protein